MPELFASKQARENIKSSIACTQSKVSFKFLANDVNGLYFDTVMSDAPFKACFDFLAKGIVGAYISLKLTLFFST